MPHSTNNNSPLQQSDKSVDYILDLEHINYFDNFNELDKQDNLLKQYTLLEDLIKTEIDYYFNKLCDYSKY